MDDIIMVRGDTLQLSISSIKTQEGEDYVLTDTDVIYLDVKKHAYDETPIFSKSITAADYSGSVLPITIYPADTYIDTDLFECGRPTHNFKIRRSLYEN